MAAMEEDAFGHAMTALPKEACDDTSVVDWKTRGGVAQDIFNIWRHAVPEGVIVSSDEDELCWPDGDVSIEQPVKMLTFVRRSGSDRCEPMTDSYRTAPRVWTSNEDVLTATFAVTGTLAELGRERNYVLVVPQAQECTKENPCPAVVSFHGAGEHGGPGDTKQLLTLGRSGLLRMATQDKACMSELKSFLLFPQLLEEESWVRTGPQVLKGFVVPLLNQIIDQYHVNRERVSVIGYSEGAFGSIHALLLFPNIFTQYVGASASLNSWHNMTEAVESDADMPWERLYTTHNHKQSARSHKQFLSTRTLTITLGEKDASGDQADNVAKIMDVLRRKKLFDRIKFNVRLLAGVTHNHWEKVFNNWGAFYADIWRGRFA